MSTRFPLPALFICTATLAISSLVHAIPPGDTPTAEEAQRTAPLISDYQQGKTRFAPANDVAPVGKCPDDLLGTFAVPANLPDPDIGELAEEMLGRGYQAGQPALTITRKGNAYRAVNLANDNTQPATISRSKANAKLPQPIACTVHMKNSLVPVKADLKLVSVDLVSMDYSKLNEAEMQQFAELVSWAWDVKPTLDDLRNVHYFFVYTFDASSVFGGLNRVPYYMPMQKLSKP